MARILLVVAMAAAFAGCSGGLSGLADEVTAPDDSLTQPDSDSTDSDSTDSDSTDGTEAADEPGGGDDALGGSDLDELTEEEILGKLGQLQGQLAIGNGPQVAVARPDGQTVTELDGSETTLAAQPTWSRDGLALAWSSVAADRQVAVIQPFDAEGLPTANRSESNATGPPIYYFQWNHDNTRLAYLRSGRRGRQTEFGTLEPGRPIDAVGNAAPFFISWSPSTDELTANLNNNSLAIIDSSERSPSPRELVELDGQLIVPTWIDEETVLALVDGWFIKVDLNDSSVERILDVGGAANFVLSPDRSSFAFQSLEEARGGITQASYPNLLQPETEPETETETEPEPESDSETEQREIPVGLTVVDLATGEQRVITAQTAISWEWSPDSQKIAWMSAERVSARPEVKWHFWSRKSDDVATAVTPTMRLPRKVTASYLPFFAQYTQSVTRWGPDSGAFAFEGIIDGRSGIWMQLVGEPSTTVAVDPQLVASGDFVTWGYGPTPDPVPSGGRSPS